MGLTFNPTVSLDALIQAAIFISAGIAGYYALKNKVERLGDRMMATEKTVATLSATLSTVAVQDNRLNHLEEDIRMLRHGEGFVRGPYGIDREYGS